MADQLLTSVASGIAGVTVGTLATWYRDRTAARVQIMDFLIQKRQELDSRTDLIEVVHLLKRELAARSKGEHPPNTGLQGWKLRDLPAFLEPVGTFLEYNPATFRKTYGFFSEEVLLCTESKLLWADDDRYDRSVYWRSFTRFVDSTRKCGYRL